MCRCSAPAELIACSVVWHAPVFRQGKSSRSPGSAGIRLIQDHGSCRDGIESDGGVGGCARAPVRSGLGELRGLTFFESPVK
jgi:hypothetical protein